MRALIFLCILSVSSTPLFSVFAQTPSNPSTLKSEKSKNEEQTGSDSASSKSSNSKAKVRVEKINPNQAKVLEKEPTQGSEVYQQQIAQRFGGEKQHEARKESRTSTRSI